jgi:protein BCP1
VGLVVSERLVNLPVQLIPPMYDMLAAELDAAVKEVSRWRDLLATGLRADTRRVAQGNDKLDFTHFLLLSRVYKMEGSDDEVNVGFGEADPSR